MKLEPYQNTGPQGSWSIYFHTPSLVSENLFFKVDNVGKYRCNKDYSTEREGYYSFMILLTISGEGKLRCKSKVYTLCREDIVFINTYDWHSYYPSSEVWEIAWLHFDGHLAENYLSHINSTAGSVIKVGNPQKFHKHIEKILYLKSNNYIYFEPTVSTIITDMLNQLVIDASKSTNLEVDLPDEIVKVINYIKSYYAQDLHIRDLLDVVHLSQSHFIRLFKKYTGYSPYEYIIKYRLNVSKYELRQTNDSIAKISDKVGFGSVSNFISTFKKYEHVTPNQFRSIQKDMQRKQDEGI